MWSRVPVCQEEMGESGKTAVQMRRYSRGARRERAQLLYSPISVRCGDGSTRSFGRSSTLAHFLLPLPPTGTSTLPFDHSDPRLKRRRGVLHSRGRQLFPAIPTPALHSSILRLARYLLSPNSSLLAFHSNRARVARNFARETGWV